MVIPLKIYGGVDFFCITDCGSTRIYFYRLGWFMAYNAAFNNISVISLWSVLLG
jgi:hypothetical protein